MYFKHLTTDDGLSQGVVNNVLVDKRGFAWFTTYDGINRFDGSRCISNAQIGPGMEGISLTKGLVEDARGDIWFGTESCLMQYSYQFNRFKKIMFPRQAGDGAGKPSFFFPVAIQHDVVLVGGGFGTCYLYDIRQNTWTRLHNPDDPLAGHPSDWPVSDKAGLFRQQLVNQMTSSEGHLFFRLRPVSKGRYQWEKQVITNPSFRPDGIYHALNDSVMLITDVDRVLWAYHFSGNRLERICQVNTKDKLSGLYLDLNGKLWIATRQQGLFVCDLAQRKVTNYYRHEEANQFSLMNDQLSAIHVSSDGIIWVASWGLGLNMARLSENGFTHRFTRAEAKTNQTDNYIRGMVQGANGHFYCNTQFGGLVELDEKLKYIRTINNGSYNTVGINPAKNILYFGEGALCTYDINSGKTTRTLNDASYTSSGGENIFYYFSPFGGGAMLASTIEGIWLMNEAGTDFSSIPGLNDSSFRQTIFSYKDSHGFIYKYSISHGLQLYKQLNGRYGPVFTFPQKFVAKYVLEKDASSAWIASTNGLYLFDPLQLKILKHYTVADGLPNNVIYALADDGMGRLWMSTNRGLCALHKASGRIKNYTGMSGMQGNEYNSHTVVTARDGRIIFGGVNGLTVVEPAKIKADPVPPSIQITALRADSSVNSFQFRASDTWRLDPGSQTLEFSFAAIEFFNPQACSLKYRLKGYDKGWVSSANPGNARYVRLPPGNYTFEVMAANADGVWGKEIKQLNIKIPALWWQEVWFRWLAAIAIVMSVILLIRAYVKQKLYRQRAGLERELAVARERERIIADLHDDVGATLSSMLIYGDLANESLESRPQESRKMIEKISSTSRELMGKMGDIIWSMKPSGEENHSLEARLKNYCNELLTPKNMLCDVEIDGQVAASITDPEAKKAILMIAKESINNIAKYSEATHVHISLKKDKNQVLLSIHDNGKGFEYGKAKSGNGIDNMHKRCVQLGGRCKLQTSPGEGVRIDCYFPVAIISHMARTLKG